MVAVLCCVVLRIVYDSTGSCLLLPDANANANANADANSNTGTLSLLATSVSPTTMAKDSAEAFAGPSQVLRRAVGSVWMAVCDNRGVGVWLQPRVWRRVHEPSEAVLPQRRAQIATHTHHDSACRRTHSVEHEDHLRVLE